MAYVINNIHLLQPENPAGIVHTSELLCVDYD